MRTLILSALALGACTPEDLGLVLIAEDLDLEWSGRFEGNSGDCMDGDVALFVVETEPGWFEGTYDYASSERGFPLSATYAIEGELVDGQLALRQVDLLGVDSPPSTNWCLGEIDLAIDPQADAPTLAGSWVPDNCACDGTVTLSEAEEAFFP